MTKSNPVRYSVEQIEQLNRFRRNAYFQVFEMVSGDPQENTKQKYREILTRWLKSYNYVINEEALAFPSEEIMKAIEYDYEKDQAEFLELFKGGDCLTYYPRSKYEFVNKGYDEPVCAVTVFPMDSNSQCAFFSNGIFLTSERLESEFCRNFKKLAQQKGYEIKETRKAHFSFIKKIHEFAALKYKDKVSVKSLPSLDEFIDDLFADGNVCLTASNELMINPEERDFLALFSDGRLIISEDYRYKSYKNQFSKVRDFEYRFSHERVIFREKAVPKKYIEEIYKKSSEFPWFVSKKKAMEDYKKHIASLQTPEEKQEMEAFVEELFKGGNKCLTIRDLDSVIRTEKDDFAFFENGRFIVNTDRHYFASVSEFQNLMGKRMPEVKITPELRPLSYLREIYKKAEKVQETCRDIYIAKLKKKAKKYKSAGSLSHHQALEFVALYNDFSSWKEVAKVKEDYAKVLLTDEEKLEESLNFLFKQAEKLIAEGMGKQEALDKIAQEIGFADWLLLSIGSYQRLQETRAARKK